MMANKKTGVTAQPSEDAWSVPAAKANYLVEAQIPAAGAGWTHHQGALCLGLS